MICHWTINRTDPQNLLSTTLDVPLHIGSFEPTVMFFGMTNLPATFQVMMNEILRDLINKGKVAVFVDDMLVETETEEGHNEIVEEILRRLEENNLYIKLEKCV